MTEKKEFELFIIMDADGDLAVDGDESVAKDLFDENIGGSGPRRIVKLKVLMSPPAVEEGPEVDIPDSAGTTTHIEAEAAE
jgi:hypothetical protein